MSFPPPDKKEKKRLPPHPSSALDPAPAVVGSAPAESQALVPQRPRPERFRVLTAAEVYAGAWQAQDAKYVAQYPLRAGETLQSLTKKRYRDGYWGVTVQPPVIRVPNPGIFVRPANKFAQREIQGIGRGVCHGLSLEFMNFRRLGFGIAQILAIFRTPDFAREFVALQKRLHPFSLSGISSVRFESQALQIAEQSLRNQSHFARKTQAPPQTPFVRRCMPYLRLTGGFELDPAMPLSRRVGTEIGTFPCCDRLVSTVRQEARGVSTTWDASVLFKPVSQTADAGRLLIEQHLFDQMQRSCNERIVDGSLKDEALPYFLLLVGKKKTQWCNEPTLSPSHAIVVEFNVVDGVLTTPRGIFDPNFGWMEPERGFCSLDFDLAINSIFSSYAHKRPYSGRPDGLIFAFQYHNATNGITDDAAYVRRWGGLPWTNYRPDAKGGK